MSKLASWGLRGGGHQKKKKEVFFDPPPPQRGLEGKKRSLGSPEARGGREKW